MDHHTTMVYGYVECLSWLASSDVELAGCCGRENTRSCLALSPSHPSLAIIRFFHTTAAPPLLSLTTCLTPHPSDDGASARAWLAPADMLVARLGAGKEVCVCVPGAMRLGGRGVIGTAWPSPAGVRGVATLSTALAYSLGLGQGEGGGGAVCLHAAPPPTAPGHAPALTLRPLVEEAWAGSSTTAPSPALLLAPLFGGGGSGGGGEAALDAVSALAARRTLGRRLAPGTRLALPLLGRTVALEVTGADPALRAVGPGTTVRVVMADNEGGSGGAAAAAPTAGLSSGEEEEEEGATASLSPEAAAAAAAAATAADAAVGGGPTGPAARAAARAAAAGTSARASGAPGAAGFASLGGVAAVAARLRDLATLPLTRPALFASYGLTPPVGVLLHGPPGTGKTALARAAAADAGAALFVVNGPDLVSGRVGGGEAGVRGVFAAARAAAPAILFFDEVDALAPAGGGQAGRFGGEGGSGGSSGTGSGGAPAAAASAAAGAAARLAAALATELDALSSAPNPPRVVVLAATNRVGAVDGALRRPGRLDAEVEVGPPCPSARGAILAACLAPVAHNLSCEDIAAVAGAAHGFVGADLALLVREAALAALRRGVVAAAAGQGSTPRPPSSLRVTLPDLAAARATVRPSAMRDITLALPLVTWDDVGGQAGVKARLMEALGCGVGTEGSAASPSPDVASPSAMAAVGATPPSGILLFGPPGCSKTLMARAAAHAAGRNFFAVKGPELLSPYVGDAEKAVAALFARARASSPSLVFFDELDGLASARDGGIASAGGGAVASDGAGAAAGRVVAQLLQEVEAATRAPAQGPASPPVVVLAATNRPDRLDPALMRPGRFDRALHVRPPGDACEREAVLRAAARKVRLGPGVAAPGGTFADLAAATPGFTGADLASLVREAALAAVAEGVGGADAVTGDHFAVALRLVAASPPPSAEEAAAYERYERAGW